MEKLNKEYWENRYKKEETGWAIGSISTPIKTYIDQLTDKSLKILIPGAGNGYEFDYLIQKGFNNVTVIDIAKQPILELIERNPSKKSNIMECDFFKLNEKYDLILEQTFFCALDPKLRKKYVEQMHHLLYPKGKLVGLLFDFPLTNEGPPFGGCTEEYYSLFERTFKIKTLTTSYNSIKPRENKELFFIFEAK
ncbi:MAG: methyltransferase domain-containing protein [Flavobacterium sp.]